MEDKELKRLLKKYRTGQASKEEVDFLHAYYNLYDALGDTSIEQNNPEKKDALKSEIRASITKKMAAGQSRSIRGKIYWTTAAAFVIALCTVVYLNRKDHIVRNSVETVNERPDVEPGGNKAILKLADGTTIALDAAENGVLAKEENITINKTDNGHLVYKANSNENRSDSLQYNTIIIPRGGQYQLTLPDGSKVWLNSASMIRFPVDFPEEERKVEVTGEAYFEVAKKTRKAGRGKQAERVPFIVVAGSQTIEVLGTRFNVNAYDDEEVHKTTLLEGSVKISLTQTPGNKPEQSSILSPGQQLQVKTNHSSYTLNIKEADTEEAVAWKNGYFKFNRSDIRSVMRQVSRWYDVDVIYKGEISRDEFVGKIKRSENVSGVLRILELSDVKCRIEGRKIIINN